MKRPLYVTDLDKTWLRSDLSVSVYSQRVWNALVHSGVLLTFATARSYEKARKLLEGLELAQPCIVLNGALIVENGKPIQTNEIDRERATAILNLADGSGVSPFVLGLEDGRDVIVHSDARSDAEKSFLNDRKGDARLRYTKVLRLPEHVLTINILGEPGLIRELSDAVRRDFGGALEIKCASDPYVSGALSLELLHPRGDKVHALASIGERLNVPKETIVVFGDHENDIEMGRFAGKCVAVSNAVDGLKTVADVVLPYSNDEDGVARYLAEECGLSV